MENQVGELTEFRKHVAPDANVRYWWQTTGRELSDMMKVAVYPAETQNVFLSYYHDVVCPLLGAAPDASDPRQTTSFTWDGSTHEYSFDIKKGEVDRPEVRFVLDASCLRPRDDANPLSLVFTDALINTLARRAPGFDSTWYRALRRYFDHSYLPQQEQKRLTDHAGHSSPILVGFDVARDLPPASSGVSMLPVVGKVYFLPCFAAAAEKTDRFTAISRAIRALPDIHTHPNILSALACIEAYLATKPKDWGDGARYLATDLVAPDRSRLKLYMRCPSTHFDDVWDFFTLGGRIPGLEEDREKYRDFIDLLGGRPSSAGSVPGGNGDATMETANLRKLTTMYFSLDDRYPFPAPKIAFYARNFADNDAVVAKGLDAWLTKYGWKGEEDSASVLDMVARVFKHRDLTEKAGIFTFVALARKDPAKRDMSIQMYMCPELYDSPRQLRSVEDRYT